MSRPSFLRHSGWLSPINLTDTLNVIGCGAVGSAVVMMAARMGWSKFRVWDFDRVEDFNLPNQIYLPRDIGKLKIDALEEHLLEFNPAVKVEKYPVPFTSAEHKGLLEGPLVIATDSMATRADITDAFSYHLQIPMVGEARLGFDYGEFHLVHPMKSTHLDMWRKSLKSDDEIPDGPCNLRICRTLVDNVASALVHALCVPYAERRADQGEWDFPFKTRFMLQDTLIVRHVRYPVEIEETEEEETTCVQ